MQLKNSSVESHQITMFQYQKPYRLTNTKTGFQKSIKMKPKLASLRLPSHEN